MKTNVGTADRIIRIILSAIIVTLFFTHVITGVIGIVFLALAGILLLTSIIRFCPLYAVFGISSNAVKAQ